MNKKPSFFRQAGVLISRYFHIFINNKQNLIMMIVIPLLTTLIVSYVAAPDMFAIKSDTDHSINNQYPVLNWELVVQEVDDEDSDSNRLIGEDDKATEKVWDGECNQLKDSFSAGTEVNDETFMLITDPAQLVYLSKYPSEELLSKNYILQIDIDLDGYEIKPIGTEDMPFTGTFEGNGHIIKNFTIDSNSDDVGLFGYVKSDAGDIEDSDDGTFYHNGIIRDLQIQNATITGASNVGGIVGNLGKTSRVYSVSVKNSSITSENENAAGVVGFVDSDINDVEIYDCYSMETSVKAENYAGGIVGNLNNSRLSGAYSVSEINCSGSYKGAVAGYCNNIQNNVKNVFYDNETFPSPKAISDEDYKDANVYAMTKEELQNSTSFLVSFKGIYSAYDMLNPDNNEDYQKQLDNESKDSNYDVEKDDDVSAVYGFKKDGQIAAFYGTQVGIFMLVIVAIFVGVCNSIGEICKERNILKREYMTNLRLDSYVTSKLVVQGVVCAIQMIIVLAVFAIFLYAKGKEIPSSGVIFPSIWIEYYISMFLLSFAADVMSLVISSFVKSASGANSLIPIVLIVQIVFCGVMFPLEGVIDLLSNVMISKWGICALAASTRLNDAQNQFLIENPSTQLSMGSGMSIIDSLYNSTAAHLLTVWGILIGFIILFAIICRVVLISVKNDKR